MEKEEIKEEELKNDEVKKEEIETDVKEKKVKENRIKLKHILLLLVVIVIIFIVAVIVIPNKKGNIELRVKSTLEKVVEKSDLETVNINYNVIAKKCKDENNCNLKSNKIEDFEYVVSCKGTITAGIDFNNVEITVDKSNKKVIMVLPDAKITDEPNITSIKFLNGDELPADELPNARRLCQETTLEKSENDNKLIPAAKEQAVVVLEQFYKQWIKAFDDSYQIEIR